MSSTSFDSQHTNGAHYRARDNAEGKANGSQSDNAHDVPGKSLRKVLGEDRSGASTPIPSDAPPSAHAASHARQQIRSEIRAIQKKRKFPTIEYAARVSHFDPESDYHDFRGFFVLWWIGIAIMVITTILRNVKETGYPFLFRQRQLFVENIWEMAISDLAMTASTFLCLPLHKLYATSSGFMRWKRGGKWIQSLFQAAWLFYWVEYVCLILLQAPC